MLPTATNEVQGVFPSALGDLKVDPEQQYAEHRAAASPPLRCLCW